MYTFMYFFVVGLTEFRVPSRQGKFVPLTTKKHYKTGLETSSSHGFGYCEYSHSTFEMYLYT